ncbi:hypothetical protein IJJ12_02625 [bacterium]|nr:hypothetical protein [bacterium]
MSRTYWLWSLFLASVTAVTLWICWPQISALADIAYLQDFYGTSQWSKPLSHRIMSDDYLYQLAGYRLATGAGIFTINPEAPPFLKWLYGLSIIWYHTGPMLNVVLGTLWWIAMLAFIVLTLPTMRQRFLAATLTVCSPLIWTQWGVCMLDLGQSLFLLCHLLTWQLATRCPRWRYLAIMLAGLSLGAFAGCKVPYFAPFIFLADAIYLWLSRRRFFPWLADVSLLLAGTFLAWLATYAVAFLNGDTLASLWHGEKWVLNFYLHAGGGVTFWEHTRVWLDLLCGWFFLGVDWWRDTEWTIIYPVFIFYLIYQAKNYICARRWPVLTYHCLLLGLLLLALTLSGYSPRYLLLILPLIIIVVTPLMAHWSKMAIFTCVSIIFCQYLFWLFPQPDSFLQQAAVKFQHGFYHDLHELSVPGSTAYTWSQFQHLSHLITYQSGLIRTEAVFDRSWVWPWQNQIVVPLTLTYSYRDGRQVTLQHRTTWRRWGRAWQLEWDDAYFGPQLMI